MNAMSDGTGFPETTDPEECDKAMKSLDTNSDGKISLDEFSVMVKAIYMHKLDRLMH